MSGVSVFGATVIFFIDLDSNEGLQIHLSGCVKVQGFSSPLIPLQRGKPYVLQFNKVFQFFEVSRKSSLLEEGPREVTLV